MKISAIWHSIKRKCNFLQFVLMCLFGNFREQCRGLLSQSNEYGVIALSKSCFGTSGFSYSDITLA